MMTTIPTTEKGLPGLLRRAGRFLAPVAIACNLVSYGLGVYLQAELGTDTTALTVAWRLVTVLILVALQGALLVWVRQQVISTTIMSLLMWYVAILVGGVHAVLVCPGVLIALFVFVSEVNRIGLVISLALTTLATTSVINWATALYEPDHWRMPASIVWALLATLATVLVPSAIGYWYGKLRDRAERISFLAQQMADGEAGRIAAAITQERRIVSQELHDTTSAHLSALLTVLAALEGGPESGDPRPLLAQVQDEGELLYDGLQRIIAGMRSDGRTQPRQYRDPQLDRHRLTHVHELIATHRRTAKVPVTLEASDDLENIDRHLGIVRSHIAYRVIQEALNNARKHAAGAAVTIMIEDDDGSVLMRVENGPGGTTSRINLDRGRAGSGAGLPGMHARVAAYGGSLRSGQLLNGGWSVNVLLPFPPRGAQNEQSEQS